MVLVQRSEIDRRAKHNVPRQCVSDYGMHKDASATPEPPAGRVIYKARPYTGVQVKRYRPLRDDLAAMSRVR